MIHSCRVLPGLPRSLCFLHLNSASVYHISGYTSLEMVSVRALSHGLQYLRPPKQRHRGLDRLLILQIDIYDGDFRLCSVPRQIRKNFSPRIDSHRMTIARPFFIMRPNLRCCYNIGLRLDSSRSQQRLPVSFPSWNRKC